MGGTIGPEYLSAAADSSSQFIHPSRTDALIGHHLAMLDLPALPRTVRDPRAELAAALRAHLGRPWFVSFSGGCDSSLVLAVATSVCRAAGAPDPTPVTLRYPDLPETDERQWQELVVRHLGLRDWEVLEIHDELDIVGPIAQPLLHAHGPLLSPFIHSDQPILAVAAGGVLITGEGGDEILGPHRVSPLLQVAHALRHRRRPSRYTVARAGDALVPAVLQRGRSAADLATWWGEWLQPEARTDLARPLVASLGPGHWSPRREMRAHLASDLLISATQNMDALARPFGVQLVHPLVGHRFASSLVQNRNWLRCRGRSTVLDAYFADLLPDALRSRADKAEFSRAYFNVHSRSFATGWDGTGLPDQVDAVALRRSWLSDRPNPQTAMLLQQAWLFTHPSASGRS